MVKVSSVYTLNYSLLRDIPLLAAPSQVRRYITATPCTEPPPREQTVVKVQLTEQFFQRI